MFIWVIYQTCAVHMGMVAGGGGGGIRIGVNTLLLPEAEFLVEKPGTKTGLLPGFFGKCFLPGICSLAIRGIFGRLPRFLPGFSNLSCFLPVLKRGLGSRFRLVL